MQRVAVVMNRAAGSSGAEQAEQVATAFRAHGIAADVSLADPDHFDGVLVEACGSGVDAVVVAGGDGSVSAAAAVAVAHDMLLGVVPAGTLNHFAKDVGAPVGDLEAAVEWLAEGTEIRVDVGDVNGKVFINNASIGAYPRMVTFRTHIQERRGWGKIRATPPAIIRTMRRLPVHVLRVTLDNGEQRVVRTPFFFVGNGLFDRHGIDVGRRASLKDRRLGIYAIETDRAWRLLMDAVVARIRGVHAAAHTHREAVDAATVEFEGGAIAIALDGEPLMLESPLVFRCRPGALRLLAGRPLEY